MKIVAVIVLIVSTVGAVLTYPRNGESVKSDGQTSQLAHYSKFPKMRDAEGRSTADHMLEVTKVTPASNEEHNKSEVAAKLPCLDQLPVTDKSGRKIQYPQETIDDYTNCVGFGVPSQDRNGKEIIYAWD